MEASLCIWISTTPKPTGQELIMPRACPSSLLDVDLSFHSQTALVVGFFSHAKEPGGLTVLISLQHFSQGLNQTGRRDDPAEGGARPYVCYGEPGAYDQPETGQHHSRGEYLCVGMCSLMWIPPPRLLNMGFPLHWRQLEMLELFRQRDSFTLGQS